MTKSETERLIRIEVILNDHIKNDEKRLEVIEKVLNALEKNNKQTERNRIQIQGNGSKGILQRIDTLESACMYIAFFLVGLFGELVIKYLGKIV